MITKLKSSLLMVLMGSSLVTIAAKKKDIPKECLVLFRRAEAMKSLGIAMYELKDKNQPYSGSSERRAVPANLFAKHIENDGIRCLTRNELEKYVAATCGVR